MSKTRINRRAVLRGALAGGALVTIPLPRLGAMFNGNGTAYAAGGPLQRFGIFFVGNGVVPAHDLQKTVDIIPQLLRRDGRVLDERE